MVQPETGLEESVVIGTGAEVVSLYSDDAFAEAAERINVLILANSQIDHTAI